MTQSLRLLALIVLCTCWTLRAQTPPSMLYPVDAPQGISGNFGELRPNHFHSGVDFRTESSIGKRVVASDDGWISRIGVSPGGYGSVLYIDHPSGLTTVYAHLDRFTPSLDSLVEEYQYQLESYVVNLTFQPGEFPVKKGELIARSGNSGSSQAPHLHYEIRETSTNDALNPLDYISVPLLDTKRPMIGGVLLAPVDRHSVVNGANRFVVFGVNNAAQTLSGKLRPTAWGRISAAIRAIDQMDETYHKFGICTAKLFVDDTLVSELHIDRVALRDSRHYNSLIYYPEWKVRRGFFLSSYKQPGCVMDLYTHLSPTNGAVVIDCERPYRFRYEVVDHAGNTSVVHFTVEGKQPDAPSPEEGETQHLAYEKEHTIVTEEVNVTIPAGVLFDNFDFALRKDPPTNSQSLPSYRIGNPETALAGPVRIAIKPEKDLQTEPRHFYLARVEGEQTSYLPSRYEEGYVVGRVHEWGSFAVAVDSVPPIVTPVTLAANGIRFTLSDRESGIRHYRATLDGRFLLLMCNSSKQSVFGKIPRKRFGAPRSRSFMLEVEDNCGNITRFEKIVVL